VTATADGRIDPRAARTRDRALTAARALLLEEGIDAVTLQRVAAEAAVGRRTMYRHWPDRRSLLHDTLASASAPPEADHADLRGGVLAHLEALDAAVSHGPLAYVVSALHERSVHDPEFDALRSELVAAGCAPLRHLLRRCARDGELPTDLDVDLAAAMLEGPVFHRAILHRSRLTRRQRVHVVDAFLASPPRRAR
jgi:TetR/AcrR family transcriptional regulator of autoinduction and epiphytic fitness